MAFEIQSLQHKPFPDSWFEKCLKDMQVIYVYFMALLDQYLASFFQYKKRPMYWSMALSDRNKMHNGLFLNQSNAASVGGLWWFKLENTFSSDAISDSISQWLKTMKIKDFLCFVFISVPQTKMWTETQESFKIICNRSCFPRKRLAIPVLLSYIYCYGINRSHQHDTCCMQS